MKTGQLKAKFGYFAILGLVVMALLVWFPSGEVVAQCAMCRATVENNANNGDTKLAAGLNNGILYLMSVPYLMLGLIAYLWFDRSKKNKHAKQARKIRSASHN